MDPNLFHLDWDRTFEVLASVVILSIFVERALALLFENRKFLRATAGRPVKEIIAFVVCAAVCIYWKFDAVSMVVLRSHTSHWGELITAGVVAGGAKGSIKLFRDVLDFKSTAYREKELADTAIAVATTMPAPATAVVVGNPHA